MLLARSLCPSSQFKLVIRLLVIAGAFCIARSAAHANDRKELAFRETPVIEALDEGPLNPYVGCEPCSSGITRIGPIEMVPSGPGGGRFPHITPGIPFSPGEFLRCPFGRKIWHPELIEEEGTTCSGCGSVNTEERRRHWVEGPDGTIAPGSPDGTINGRPPEKLIDGPIITFDPPVGIPNMPTGPYDPIPGLGEHNCGTALLCYLVGILGIDGTNEFMRQADKALQKQKGDCDHFAWSVVDPDTLQAILNSCIATR